MTGETASRPDVGSNAPEGAAPPVPARRRDAADPGRWGRAVLRPALVVAIGAAGCGNEDTPSMLDPEGAGADRIAELWWLLFGLGAAVYAVVAALIVVSWRRAARPGLRVHRFVLVGGVALPALVLTVVGIETVRATGDVFGTRDSGADLVVEGEQWWWRVSYPGEDVVTANEVHIPAGEEVTIELRSDDVVHSFWVPELTGKVDLVPGQTNRIVLEATEAGSYRGQCAEFCGIQHANMAFVVVAHAPDDYAAWLDARRDAPPAPEPGTEAARGEQVFLDQACAGCHRVAGTPAQATVGPDLSDVGARDEIGAGVVENTPENLADWVRDAQDAKPGAAMPPIELSDEEVDALVAYLDGLDPR